MSVEPRRRARVLHRQQCGQSPGLGDLGERGGDDSREPDRVGGEVAVLGSAGRGDETLVERHIDDRQHVAGALGQLGFRRHGEGDASGDDLPLRAHDPLRQRGLADQERPRDLRGREADDRAQRQRQPGLGCQRRVAAREQQGQPVIGGRVLCVRRPDPRRPLAEPALPHSTAYAVQRVALGSDCQPRGGVVRGPVTAPRRDRLDDRRLHGLLGQVEVTEPA